MVCVACTKFGYPELNVIWATAYTFVVAKKLSLWLREQKLINVHFYVEYWLLWGITTLLLHYVTSIYISLSSFKYYYHKLNLFTKSFIRIVIGLYSYHSCFICSTSYFIPLDFWYMCKIHYSRELPGRSVCFIIQYNFHLLFCHAIGFCLRFNETPNKLRTWANYFKKWAVTALQI